MAYYGKKKGGKRGYNSRGKVVKVVYVRAGKSSGRKKKRW